MTTIKYLQEITYQHRYRAVAKLKASRITGRSFEYIDLEVCGVTKPLRSLTHIKLNHDRGKLKKFDQKKIKNEIYF